MSARSFKIHPVIDGCSDEGRGEFMYLGAGTRLAVIQAVIEEVSSKMRVAKTLVRQG